MSLSVCWIAKLPQPGHQVFCCRGDQVPGHGAIASCTRRNSSSGVNGRPSYLRIVASAFTPCSRASAASCPVAFSSTAIRCCTPVACSRKLLVREGGEHDRLDHPQAQPCGHFVAGIPDRAPAEEGGCSTCLTPDTDTRVPVHLLFEFRFLSPALFGHHDDHEPHPQS